VATVAVAGGIFASPESYGDFLTQKYRLLLGRDPEAGGFGIWRSRMQTGMDPRPWRPTLPRPADSRRPKATTTRAS
jgi:hypothetical protein